MLSTLLALVMWTLVVQDAGQSPPSGTLATAKSLYASGDYETALSTLASVKADESVDEVEEYRLLCLLALGRTAEAQTSLEALVLHNPLFTMSVAEVSPRLVSIFHDVRKRVLPDVVRDLYAKAKTDFEQKNYDAAKGEFETLMTLLADDDMADKAASLADMKMLADGFLKLATAQIAAKAEAANVPAPTPTPAAGTDSGAGKNAPAEAPVEPVFSVEDKEVTPPVEVNCPLPEWNPTNPTQNREFRGVLRVVIDKDGKVESASLLVPANPAYDPLLLAAAKDWQYRPATRAGVAVKYQKLIPILLRPRIKGGPAA